jgi:hypothetical protein
MGGLNNKGVGNRISGKLVVVLIGLLASCIGVFAFITNNQSIQDLITNWTNPRFIKNPLAETDGIIWRASFYNNKELKDPVTFEGDIKGARNGLRVNWGAGSPNKKVNNDFFSGIFTATVDFNAGSYCFMLEVDDGARLFIDGQEIRNAWWTYVPGAVYQTPHQLSQGSHTIQLYYFDEYENSSFHVSWYENPGIACITLGHPDIP